MRLTKTQRSIIRNKFGGRCAYCGCELPEKGWHADHVNPVIRVIDFDESSRKLAATGELYRPENDTENNLYPACAPCNLFKTTFSLEQFRSQIAEQVNRARLYSVNFRTAERFGQVQATESPVIFWFEKYRAGK